MSDLFRHLDWDVCEPGRKPTVPVEIDRGHHIGNHTTYCNLFQGESRNLVNGAKDALVGNTYVDPKGAYFDGVGDRIDVHSSVDFDQHGDFTVLIKFNPSSTTPDPYPVLIGRGSTGSGEWMIRWWTSGDTLRAYANSGDLNITSASNLINRDEDQTCALVRKGNVWTLYHNGISAGTDTTSGFSVTTSQTMQLGVGKSETNREYKGWLDCVYGLPYALNPTQILAWHHDSYQLLIPRY